MKFYNLKSINKNIVKVSVNIKCDYLFSQF